MLPICIELCEKKDVIMEQILNDIVCKVCANLGVKPVQAIFDRYSDMWAQPAKYVEYTSNLKFLRFLIKSDIVYYDIQVDINRKGIMNIDYKSHRNEEGKIMHSERTTYGMRCLAENIFRQYSEIWKQIEYEYNLQYAQLHDLDIEIENMYNLMLDMNARKLLEVYFRGCSYAGLDVMHNHTMKDLSILAEYKDMKINFHVKDYKVIVRVRIGGKSVSSENPYFEGMAEEYIDFTKKMFETAKKELYLKQYFHDWLVCKPF